MLFSSQIAVHFGKDLISYTFILLLRAYLKHLLAIESLRKLLSAMRIETFRKLENGSIECALKY